ncbi:hypothetical protein [Schumannella luteola]
MQKLLVAAIAAVVLVLGAAVPALAIQTQSWEERRIATEAFDAAAETALEASADSATATQLLDDARESAEPVLEDARAVAASAPGYFNSSVLDPLVTAVADLEATVAVEAPDGLAMPETERPESVEELRAGVEPLSEWTDAETERAAGVTQVASDLSEATEHAQDALLALAETVEAEASGALAAAPLATPESRAAVEAARDAVVAAIEDGPLSDAVAAYAGAVAALRSSQQAAADAAAAAERSSSYDRDQLQLELRNMMRDLFGYSPEDCVDLPDGTYACGGVP